MFCARALVCGLPYWSFHCITSEFPPKMLEVLLYCEGFSLDREVKGNINERFEAVPAKPFRPEPTAHFLVLDSERPTRHAMRREGQNRTICVCF